MNETNKTRARPVRLGFAIPLILLAGCAAEIAQIQPTPSLNQPSLSLKEKAESMLLHERINKIRLAATNFAMKA